MQIPSKLIGSGAIKAVNVNADAVTGQTAETVADNADLVLIYDNSATALKKMTRSNFLAGITVSQVYKEGAALVSDANVSLTGEQTIDGVLTSASRILLVGQTAPEENGLYVTAAGAWARASDMDASAEVFMGQQVYVQGGDVHGHSRWVLNTSGPFTLGTTGLVFYKLDEDKKEDLTLNGTDITNEYKDAGFKMIPNSLLLMIDGAVMDEGSDYSLSEVGGVTRISFSGLYLDPSSGASALQSGDILRLKYKIKR